MTHKQKLKLARKLRNKKETENKTPVFQTKNWEIRRKSRQGGTIK